MVCVCVCGFDLKIMRVSDWKRVYSNRFLIFSFLLHFCSSWLSFLAGSRAPFPVYISVFSLLGVFPVLEAELEDLSLFSLLYFHPSLPLLFSPSLFLSSISFFPPPPLPLVEWVSSLGGWGSDYPGSLGGSLARWQWWRQRREGWREVGKEIRFHISSALLCLPHLPPPLSPRQLGDRVAELGRKTCNPPPLLLLHMASLFAAAQQINKGSKWEPSTQRDDSFTSFTSHSIPAEIFYILHRVFSFSWMCGKGETASGRLLFLENLRIKPAHRDQWNVFRVTVERPKQ